MGTATWRAIRAKPLTLAIGAAVVVAAFALYVATAARDIVYGDTPELTGVALTWGVAHPPGYPLWTALGWVFGQLATGPLPFRIALLSAVCHAATVGVVYATAYRFARGTLAAAVAATALATDPLFWSWSLVGEVFPLNDLLAALMLLLVALWHEHPERKWLFVGGALVGGLGVANHQTIVLAAPAVFYVMWRRRRTFEREPSLILRGATAFGIGLLPYLALPIAAARHPFWSWGDLRSPGDLVAHFLRQSYGTTSLIVDPKFTGGSPTDRLVALGASFDVVLAVLVIAGAVYAWRRLRWYATYLLVAFGVAGPGFISYTNAKITEETTRAVIERFFLMPHVILAPLTGFAVLAAGEAAARIRLPRRVVEPAIAGIAIVAAATLVPLNYRGIDQSDNHFARTFAEDLFATIKPNSIFLAGGDPVVFPVGYLQSIEGVRPDVTSVFIPVVPADWYIRELKREHRDLVFTADRYGPGGGEMRSFIDANRKRPIAAIGDLPDDSLRGAYWFYSRGVMYEVRAVNETVTLDDMTAENIELLGMYRPAHYEDLVGPHRSWERLTLVDYAQAYYRVGKEYEIAGDSLKEKQPKRAADLYDGARQWYEQALKVNPTLIEASEGLARLPH